MRTAIPKGFEKESREMKSLNNKILAFLRKRYNVEKYPDVPKKKSLEGEACVEAFPMQGILKYHGMADWHYRTAFFPSVSMCNDAAKTVTYVRFDQKLGKDHAVVNGKKIEGHELDRIKQTLDFIRKITGAKTKAFVCSKNILKAQKTGKGLGTSASASAALALAAIEATLGDDYSSNSRFVTTCARFLSGSGCRSAAGGVALWLSYPGISHEDSFAVRLDSKQQFRDVDLITIPVDSRIGLKTEMAHKDAPNSPFFKTWMGLREKHIWEIFDAVSKKNWKKLGELAELDTILLHGTTMSGGDRKLIGWEPETIELMRAANDLRESNVPVYYSVDTGPTTVLITQEKYSREVVNHIKSLGFTDIVTGKIAGPAGTISKLQGEKEFDISLDDVSGQLK